jgi:uncharacterized lipoprotein NlpE involved in copper resistance
MRTKITLWAAVAIMAASCGQVETPSESDNTKAEGMEEMRGENDAAPMGGAAESGSNAEGMEWVGTYTGVLPCNHCEGMQTTLILGEESAYKLVVVYMGRSGEEFVSRGRLAFYDDGTHFSVKHNNKDTYVFRIAGDKLIMLDTSSGRGAAATATEHTLSKQA